MQALNAGIKKIATLDKYLVDHCWTVACDHYLDGGPV